MRPSPASCAEPPPAWDNRSLDAGPPAPPGCLQQGRWDDAIASYERSLAIKRELGDAHGQGQTLNNLGMVYHQQGRWGDAIGCYEQSLAIAREVGDRHGEGQTLANLGMAVEARGDRSTARQDWRDALAIFDPLGAPVRSLLEDHHNDT